MAENKGMGIGSTIANVAGGMLGMIGQNSRANKAQERQKELMGIQFENQKKLNQQGSELQMQMWKDTNYPAQLKMMKEAGLNPGLMYGQGGGGGTTTGSQGGGSAASGNAAAPMDIGQALQAGMMKAQIDNINADTDLKKNQSGTEDTRQDKFKKELDGIESTIKLNASAALKNKSEADKNKSIEKLNKSIASLNDQKVLESIQNTALIKSDLDWQKESGMHKNDPIIGKTVKYLSQKTGLEEATIIYMVGGAIGIERLLKALPTAIVDKVIGAFGKSGKIGF